MGNCLCDYSSVNIVGLVQPTDQKLIHTKMDCKSCNTCGHDQKIKVVVNEKNKSKRTREVKIKITKKQLEELLYRANVNDLTVEQVLVRLINVGSGDHDQLFNQPPWKPDLQSIPE
ncbi:hypothetical protein ACFE04_005599 [Oxalis oulophora]